MSTTEIHRDGSRGTARATRRIALVALFSLVLFPGSGLATVETRGSLSAFTDHVNQQVVDLMDVYDIPGATLALVQDGVLVWSEAYGYADVATGRPMTVDTVNRTESISKSVTAWGVMRLIEQGRLGLDDPVTRHLGTFALPESPFSLDGTTVRRLLSHDAGMPLGTVGVHYPPDGKVPFLSENLSREARLVREPGSGFLYSNVGFNLLELLIEELTGESFAVYMGREVLTPLGMDNSTFEWSRDITPPVPNGHDLEGTAIPVYVYPEKGSGGLLASVEDIARFVIAGMTSPHYKDNGVLTLDGIRQLHTPTVEIGGIFGIISDSYGLGHFLEDLPNGEQAVWHGGQGSGWMTHFHSVPETGDGIVILTNSQRSWPMISAVLRDWAQWSGAGSVGMGTIARAVPVLWALIAVIGLLSLWQAWRLARDTLSGHRRMAPLSRDSRILRSVQGVVFVGLVSTLMWSRAQDYLFLSSVFPRATGWLGISTFGLAIAMLFSALLPRTPDVKKSVSANSSR